MKAMVLAAGLGSRLKDITTHTPKCLVEAGGKTLLQHVLERLKSAGVTEVIINLFHLGEKVESYLAAHNQFGLTISFSREHELLGTGGGIQAAAEYFKCEDAFFVYNGDIYSTIDLNAMLRVHRERNALATLAVLDRPSSRPLLFDETYRLAGWEHVEDRRGEVFGTASDHLRLGFTGVQILSPKIFQYFTSTTPSSSITAFMNAAKAGEEVIGYPVDGSYWIDIGTPERLTELKALLAPRDEMH